ncbi:MAG: nitroreductase family protein [Thermoplasmata archaeon]
MDVEEAIRSLRACYHFEAKPLPPEKLKSILSAARLSPSQRNLQPWRFVVVRDDERKRLLAQACSRHRIVAEAPAVIVAFAIEEDIPITIGGYISAYPLDVAVAIHSLQLAAQAEGLGTAWMIDFNDEKVHSVLGAPAGVHPIAVIPIGFPAPANGHAVPPSDQDGGRKSPDEIIAYDAYPW